jgi:hypothetical protein
MGDMIDHVLLTRQKQAILELISMADKVADTLEESLGVDADLEGEDDPGIWISSLDVLDWLAGSRLTLRPDPDGGDADHEEDLEALARMMRDDYPQAWAGKVGVAMCDAGVRLVRDPQGIAALAHMTELARQRSRQVEA